MPNRKVTRITSEELAELLGLEAKISHVAFDAKTWSILVFFEDSNPPETPSRSEAYEVRLKRLAKGYINGM